MNDRGNLLSRLRFAFCVAASLVTFSLLAPRCPAQERKYPPVESLDAHAIFRAYCAPCHGLDGKGHGPAASALNSKVADLTLLTKHARGQFPSDRVRNVLEGTQSPAGSRALPLTIDQASRAGRARAPPPQPSAERHGGTAKQAGCGDENRKGIIPVSDEREQKPVRFLSFCRTVVRRYAIYVINEAQYS
jgi:hypothetical protein